MSTGQETGAPAATPIERSRDIHLTLGANKIRPACLSLTAHLNEAKIDHMSATLTTRTHRPLAFAMGWDRNRIVYVKDDGRFALWLDGAAFDLTEGEVRRVIDAFGKYGLGVRDSRT